MRAVLISLLATACACARAEDGDKAKPDPDDGRYLIGASVAYKPEYDGARGREVRIRPLWAAKIGRVRISTSGSGGLLGFGRSDEGGGASTQFVDTDKLRLGVSVSLDSGRDSDDSSTTQGLPDVKRTLRARFYANYNLTENVTLGGNVNQDMLGHRGGTTFSVDLGWRIYRSRHLEITSGAGVTAANALNLKTYFGVPQSAVVASGKPAYEPGAGLRDVHAGLGFTRPFGRHWIFFGSAGVSRLLGPAGDSPLVETRLGKTVGLGLAWRS